MDDRGGDQIGQVIADKGLSVQLTLGDDAGIHQLGTGDQVKQEQLFQIHLVIEERGSHQVGYSRQTSILHQAGD